MEHDRLNFESLKIEKWKKNTTYHLQPNQISKCMALTVNFITKLATLSSIRDY